MIYLYSTVGPSEDLPESRSKKMSVMGRADDPRHLFSPAESSLGAYGSMTKLRLLLYSTVLYAGLL